MQDDEEEDRRRRMNFIPEEVCIILDTIEEEIPFGAAGWDKVAEQVNASFA